MGSGLAPVEFRCFFAQGRAGHAGLQESVAFIAHALDWKLGSIVETCEAVVAQHGIRTAHVRVRKGQTCKSCPSRAVNNL